MQLETWQDVATARPQSLSSQAKHSYYIASRSNPNTSILTRDFYSAHTALYFLTSATAGSSIAPGGGAIFFALVARPASIMALTDPGRRRQSHAGSPWRNLSWLSSARCLQTYQYITSEHDCRAAGAAGEERHTWNVKSPQIGSSLPTPPCQWEAILSAIVHVLHIYCTWGG